MSEEGRGRRRSGSRAVRYLWGGGAIVLIVVLVNLALSARGGADAASSLRGLVDARLLMGVLLWSAFVLVAGLAAAGGYFAKEAHDRTGRPANQWLMRAFMLVPSSLVVLIVAVYDNSVFPREVLCVLAAFLMAAQLAPFVWSARLAAETRGGGGRTRRRSSRSGESESRDPAENAEVEE